MYHYRRSSALAVGGLVDTLVRTFPSLITVMRFRALFLSLLAVSASAGAAPAKASAELDLPLRRGDVIEKTSWKAAETAVIICDMWDNHTCKGAAARVAALAPKVEAFVSEARSRGVLIVHSPSDVMKFYNGTPQRVRAQSAPVAKPPVTIRSRELMPERESPLPIDDSDWCDCRPKCDIQAARANGWPWKRQIATIRIQPEDAVSDQGTEIYNLFEQRGIKNVIICGVHTNICVLKRSFGIRQMVLLGKNVALARDLTDCLYDPAKRPFTSHDNGTALLVQHIEKFWCPSLASTDLVRN
jgi:nicotinamidase-related amidase